MNAELKTRWLEALRSGQYKQGRSLLRYDQHYCCLGVLCDLLAKESKGQWMESPGPWAATPTVRGYFQLQDDVDHRECYELSPQVLKLVNITEKESRALQNLNDKDRKTFSEIADWIEENL